MGIWYIGGAWQSLTEFYSEKRRRKKLKFKIMQKHGKRVLHLLEPATQLEVESWCSLRCVCTYSYAPQSASPRPTTHLIGSRALLKPKNLPLLDSNHCRPEWRPKRFHVQKQVVQLGAGKNNPKINCLAIHRWS